MSFTKLLSPIKIGAIELKNRFIVPAMGAHLGEENGQVSQRTIDYYSARAKGGFGLIITEFTCIDPGGLGMPGQLGIWDDSFIAGHKKLTDEVHKNGGLIFCQLHHAGRLSYSMVTGKQPVAPSPIASPSNKEIPRELKTEEVYELIDKFVDGAVRAKSAGYDGVELHGAHQYMIAQFMSPYSNKRLDEFGGHFQNRMRFPVEIIKKIKQKCGVNFPVSIRISAEESEHESWGVRQARTAAKVLEEAGADVINVSIGGAYGTSYKTLAPQAIPPGFNAVNSAFIKEMLQVPVIVTGRIVDPYIAEDIIASGSADMVSLGRPSLADPEFPNKVKENRIDEIIPCVACLQRCAGAGGRDEWDTGVSCTYNPFTGKEGILRIVPSDKPKKIAIIGAGPAGLETAWIAAKRGHSVTVFDKADRPGGQIALGARPPYKQELLKAVQTYMTLGKKHGVTYKFGIEATPETVTDFDEIVLATGGVPIRPAFEGIDQADVIQAIDILAGKPAGDKVIIIGGGQVGVETGEMLANQNHQVTIVEMKDEIATEEHPDIRFLTHQRLIKYGVNILTRTKVKALSKGSVTVEKDGIEQTLSGFDSIVLAVGTKSYNPLEKPMQETGKKIHIIGDARKSGNITDAIYEAAKLGVSI
ncbi:MAG TPA: NAD(P)/FAD-dependent oxidoreductase [Pseudobacteroides sp.]|nr:NAD(P)/FAD-dependent oxidoreductase [Pseudobacteroides sp.]